MDQLKVFNILKTKFSEAESEALINEFRAVRGEDISEIKTDLKGVRENIQGLKTEIGDFKTELRKEMGDFKAELRKEIGDFKADMLKEMIAHGKNISSISWKVAGLLIAQGAAIVTLLKLLEYLGI